MYHRKMGLCRNIQKYFKQNNKLIIDVLYIITLIHQQYTNINKNKYIISFI